MGDEAVEARFGEIVDFYGLSVEVVWANAEAQFPCVLKAVPHRVEPPTSPLADEIVQLVASGPPSNRIDLVFMVRPDWFLNIVSKLNTSLTGRRIHSG